ncbi:MAG: ABC transporter substrate-binding protein [Treponema sp.]|nr:ABC transporter substrate-binding protein [Treponema sp.]
MKKSVVLVGIVSIFLSLLQGCNKEDQSNSLAKPTETVSGVKDDLGRNVVIPQNPQRILALNSASMEALFNLGITPVGKIENYKIRKEGMSLPSVGMPAEINIEAVCNLGPDLIFAHSRFHSGMIEELEQSGAVVYCFNPDNIEGTLTMYIGRLIGKEAIAKEYDDTYVALCQGLSKSVHQVRNIQTGIIVQAGDTVKAAQTASGYGALLVNLGIKNIVPEGLPNSSNASFVDFDMETITTENPDIILIVSAGGKGNTSGKNKYLKDPAWADLDATKNGALIILPDSVNPNKATQSDMIQTTADCIIAALKK